MHRLLLRQLKKAGIDIGEAGTADALARLLAAVDQTYRDADEDRSILEHSLEVSSAEMQELYGDLQRNAQKSEAKYARLIDNLRQHYFFYTHDPDGVFSYVSDSITDVLGYTKEEFLSPYKSNLTDDPMNEQVNVNIRKAGAGEVLDPFQLSIYHKDGTVRVLEVMEQPVFDAEGKVVEVEGIARDVTQIIAAQSELNFMAQHDSLTGISNRMNLFIRMEHLLATAKREGKSFALLFIDLDYFKHINDTLGHDVGDRVLKIVVERIRGNLREEDTFARIGGDEFVIVFDGVGRNDLLQVVKKVRGCLHAPLLIGNHELRVSASIGVAIFPDDGEDEKTLMKHADIAMYKAKKSGRDSVHFFTEALNDEIQQEMQMELDMIHALEAGEFSLYFQPKVTTEDDTLIGAEALLRWHHPERGIIYPEQFIARAEQTGFIVKLGRWVVEEGCRAIAEFNRVCKLPLHLSVNLSAYQLQHDDILEVIAKAIEATDIDPLQLSIEVTETVYIHKMTHTLKVLQYLQAMGIRICLDDFGTGYSSLSYLHRYPVNAIKIDKSFIALIEEEGSKEILLDTIIAMGQTLGLQIIAEGVETRYQLECLRERGCKYYQGYLFSEPLPKSEYITLLKQLGS